MLLLAVETDWSSLVWFVGLSGLFCLSLISRLYGAGNCWHRLSGVRSKLTLSLSTAPSPKLINFPKLQLVTGG